jgi:serine protease Do
LCSTVAVCMTVLAVLGQTQGSGPFLVLHVQTADRCGWMGVQVRPMTRAFAASLGMALPYGAIFDRPEPGTAAANASIEAGDVLTSINGSPVMASSDVPAMISAMAPGSVVYLNTFRNRQMIKVSLILGSRNCMNETNGGA